MAVDKNDDNFVVARYEEGVSSADDVSDAIAATWSALLSEAAARRQIAESLGLPEDDLDPSAPPFSADVRSSGLSGGEIAIIGLVFVVSNIAAGALQKSGADISDRLKKVWADFLESRVNPPGKDRLGRSMDDR